MKIKDIINICDGLLLKGNDEIEVYKFSKDTRSINKNDVYVGIKGEKFDGNMYIKDAVEKGAIACIIDNKDIDISNINIPIVYVKNSILALGNLAKYKRSLFKGTVIGITGSVGKTTTKDLIFSILSKKYKTLTTIGNSNNNIGLPLSVLNGEEAEVWVIEMGMNNYGEISYLSKIVQPNYAVITNIGTSHIGNLGSRENILKAKLEILDGMKNGLLIINNDNDLLNEYYINHSNNIITVGIKNESDYNVTNINENVFSINEEDKYELFSSSHELMIDAMLGYAIGKLLNVSERDIKDVFKNYNQQGNRLNQQISKSGFIVVNDAYNASYDSMKVAIEYLSKYDKRSIIVLGDMLELGTHSKELHLKVGEDIAKSKINILLTVGQESKYIVEGAKNNDYNGLIKHFDDNNTCFKYIESIIDKNDIILFKASHSMNFIDLCNKVKEL